MSVLKSIWAWLNGNKTLFGLAILYFVNQEGDLFGSAFAEMIFAYIGNLLSAGGLAHKAVKAVKKLKK